MSLPNNLQSALSKARTFNRPLMQGHVSAISGVAIEAMGLQTGIGDLCTVKSSLGDILAEVVGFDGTRSVLMPLGDCRGIAPLDSVIAHRQPLKVIVGDALLGRVVDGLGRPIDDGGAIIGQERIVSSDAPKALSREPICTEIETGLSAIDGFLTCGRGQRIGIFSGSGVGKSTVLGTIAKNGSADVNVIALIGERGREVKDFIEDSLGPKGMARSVVVVATSDAAPMLRFKGAFVAVTIAEGFREQGKNVMFMMDSVTRFAGAAREIGLAAGEPPTLRGYPPSLFSQLPRLVERLGNDDRGSITGLLAVLVDGDDLNEPVSDALRGYLDGHIVLSREIATRGRFPAIDVLASISRLMPKICTPDRLAAVSRVRELLAHYEESRDLVQVGAYRKGADPLLDEALEKMPAIENLLYHGTTARTSAETQELIDEISPAPVAS